MGTPPLQKNGHDQSQDRDIRELREHFRQVRMANDRDHGVIMERLGGFQVQSGILRVLGILFLTLLASVGGFIAGGARWVSSLEDEIHEVKRVGSTEGRLVDVELRNDVNELKADMRECLKDHRQLSGKD